MSISYKCKLELNRDVISDICENNRDILFIYMIFVCVA